LVRAPADLAGEAGELRDGLGEVADRDLDAGAEVDGLRLVVALRGEPDPLGGVLDVEELARRRAVAPEHDLALAALARLEHLADQGRDHVRGLETEIVA